MTRSRNVREKGQGVGPVAIPVLPVESIIPEPMPCREEERLEFSNAVLPQGDAPSHHPPSSARAYDPIPNVMPNAAGASSGRKSGTMILTLVVVSANRRYQEEGAGDSEEGLGGGYVENGGGDEKSAV